MDPSNIFLTYLGFLFVVHGAIANTEILRSRAATARQSTTFEDHGVKWSADRAIDGNPSTGTISSNCGCCAATVNEYRPWLQIDLRRLYRLSTIEVIGRTDVTDTFEGMYIILYNQSSNVRTVIIPQGLQQFQYHKFKFDPPVIAQYVKLQLPGDFVLLCVCEVKIYSNDCSAGTYGASCNETCGHCQNGAICDHVTGECGLCEPGYRGLICKDKCEPGTYGENCLHNCGNCYGDEVCDRRTGSCNLCSSGYRGQQCMEECPPGTFGQNCSSTCGNCQSPCHFITGVCTTGCLPGYTGTNCTEVCDNGFYGEQCQSDCGHCANNVTCNNTNGRCEDGCREGYTGDRCDVEPDTLESNSDTSSSTVIGALVGTIVVLVCVLVVVLVVIIWRMRRNTIYEEPNWNTRETQEQTYAELDNTVGQQEPDTDRLGTDVHEYADVDINLRREGHPSDNAVYVNA